MHRWQLLLNLGVVDRERGKETSNHCQSWDKRERNSLWKEEKEIERETHHTVFSSAGYSLDRKYDHPVNR